MGFTNTARLRLVDAGVGSRHSCFRHGVRLPGVDYNP